jgi:NAD(P)-dependent dehydrogenase (short-subunit alcohol dehydrogenase family)
MSKLFGKIAVVTGGTGGLGQSVVRQLLEEQATVIVTHMGNQRSRSFVELIQKTSSVLHDEVVDVTSEKNVAELVDRIKEKFGNVDILCNLVGGVGKKQFIEEISLEEWNRLFTLNLTSCFLMMRSVLPLMKEKVWGRIVNITAMPAIHPEAKRGGYGVAKSAVITLTKTAAEEVKEYHNITVNAIAPSIILTEENKRWGTEEDFKKWVTPEQIAEMIVFLCSDSGAAMNGQVIQMYGKI